MSGITRSEQHSALLSADDTEDARHALEMMIIMKWFVTSSPFLCRMGRETLLRQLA